MRALMATRGTGATAEAEMVLVDVERGRVFFSLDDADRLSFDLEELRAELSIAESAADAETRMRGAA